MRRSAPLLQNRASMEWRRLKEVVHPGTDYRVHAVFNAGFNAATDPVRPQEDPQQRSNPSNGDEIWFIWAQKLGTLQQHIKLYKPQKLIFAHKNCGLSAKRGSPGDWTKQGILPADAGQYFLVVNEKIRNAAESGAPGALRAALIAEGVQPSELPD
ncbi:hypothetical protein [Mitsuaria sp. GD03876]|uniref:hypothetical protein n=1 Tax=Mitsuaria sp. GD03876 TaxID=2975399 RepID=UPI00244BA585|nr:hypothetical protein [Mitsuaria sp. GD03876]MDH0867547.1 hypothetical protein [Mitsuaria sp. GD03876]